MSFQFNSFQSSSVHSFPSFHLFAPLTSSTPFHFIHVRPKTKTMPKILQNSSMQNERHFLQEFSATFFCLEIGQLHGALSQQQLFGVLLHHLLCLGSTGLHQKSDNFKVPFLSCYEKRRCSIVCPALGFVGTGLNQKSDNFKMPILSCYKKRRCSIVCRALVFVGTGLNQKSDNFKMPSLSCYKKRRCSIICRALVYVGTSLNQKSDNFKVPLMSRNVKRRCSKICRTLVFVGTRLYQKSDNFKMPLKSCYGKRRCS